MKRVAVTPLHVAAEIGNVNGVRELLAAAGHGEVYIKTVELDQDGVPSRALREVALLRELSHVNVVRMLGVYLPRQPGENHLLLPGAGRLELVLESADQNLCKYLEESAPEGLRLPMVRSFLEQILRGLAYCHSRGVMHRN